MSSIRRSASLIEKGYKTLGTRKFFASSHRHARPAARSPRVSMPGQPRPGSVRVRQSYNADECLPPVALLNSARKSGALDVDPETALQFLRKYQHVAGQSSTGWEQRLCDEFQIQPSVIVLLAGILGRSNASGQKMLAKKLMMSASELGEHSATFELVSSALRRNSISDVAAPLHRLGLLAKNGNDPQAMTLLGKVLLSQRAERDALEWFRKATNPPTGRLDFDGAGEALVHEGRILLGWKDRDGAEVVFRKAALELDEPSAYFYLSQLQEPGSADQEIYLLKAASSGIVEACHNLGSLELAKVEKQPLKEGSVPNYGMAREWFQIAAAEGFGLSILNMALIFKAMGKSEDGIKWLEKAEEIPEVREQARGLSQQWSRPTMELSGVGEN